MLLFRDFSQQLSQIEKVSSRLQITALLAELLQKIEPAECPAIFNLLQGQLLPPWEKADLFLADKMIIKTLARLDEVGHESLFGEVDRDFSELALSEQEKKVRQLVKQVGDLGQAAEQIVEDSASQSKNLSIHEVYEELLNIAAQTGSGSQEAKINLLRDLLLNTDGLSARFIVRIIAGKLRLGMSQATFLDALSWTIHGDKTDSAQLEDALQKRADLAQLAATYLFARNSKKRTHSLTNYSARLGTPIINALCQRLNSAADIIDKMTEVIAEPKYDGLRTQIHFYRESSSLRVKAFTRNLNDVSQMYPELTQLAQFLDQQGITNAIFDSEVVGITKDGQVAQFQETMTRRRLNDVAQKAQELPARFFIFDLLFLNDRELLNTPLSERKELLSRSLPHSTPFWEVTQFIQTDNATVLHDFHNQQLKVGLEGAVIKQVNSIYQSGRKGWSWVKIKEAEGTRGKLSDTLDLVIMGYYLGRGRRHDLGLGAILVGVRDEHSDKLLSISKVGTGFTDEQLTLLKQKLFPLKLDSKPALYEVDKTIAPDIWVEPVVVVEIAADDLTDSKIHTSQKSLRFPRLISFRDDKNAADATAISELSSITL
ncbi:ATP-dependent DNA ligase [Microgenomates group bacterium]|nr:ATP-dependent DNA ligase [Microgenomates group bacterium]